MSKYAIIESGSKQFRVEQDTVLDVELLNLEDNPKEVTLDRVLLVRDGKKLQVGNPVVKSAKVVCDYLGDVRGSKVISFKFRRRKASRSKRGHRQTFSKLKVKEIIA